MFYKDINPFAITYTHRLCSVKLVMELMMMNCIYHAIILPYQGISLDKAYPRI